MRVYRIKPVTAVRCLGPDRYFITFLQFSNSHSDQRKVVADKIIAFIDGNGFCDTFKVWFLERAVAQRLHFCLQVVDFVAGSRSRSAVLLKEQIEKLATTDILTNQSFIELKKKKKCNFYYHLLKNKKQEY